jgi:hypothetical protein
LSSLNDSQRQQDRSLLAVELTLQIDGRGHLFAGRAAQLEQGNPTGAQNKRIIYETIIAGNFAAFLATLGTLYRLAGYHGQLDIGAAITGLRDGQSIIRMRDSSYFYTDRYKADTFRRTERIAASRLTDAKGVTRGLFRRLFNMTSAQQDFDPFA